MKLTTSVLVLALAGAAFAQAPAAKTAAPAAKPAAAAKSTPVKSSTATAAPQTRKAAARMAAKKTTAKKAEAPAVAAAKGNAAKATAASNRRDPFMSIIMKDSGPPCAGGGKKCLAIDQITLRGVVRAPNGALALVTSVANKSYTLRENDPVYNGVVVKITGDSIVFRESVMDRLGRMSQREVVKKVNNSPV